MADTDNTETLDMAVLKQRLLDERARLLRDIEIKEHQVAEDGDELDSERGGVGNHMADDANQTSEQETMLTLESSIRRHLNEVDGALARMDAGTYGTCSNCGKPISPARLEARPDATLCIDCKQKQDNGRL